jgi:uncharacterized protein (TIGR03083 family)
MPATTFDYRQSLQLLRSEIEALNRRIAALLPAQWHQESHCPGWSVADLVMHVVRNGEAFLQFSQQILAHDDTPVCGFGYPDPREAAVAGPEGAPRDVAIRNLGPRGCAALQAQHLEDYSALLSGLSEMEQRQTGLWAGMCPRTAPWGCRQRLAEVAYHHWDLRCSLGEEAALDAVVAREVLAYRLEPSHSPLFRWRPADGAAVQTVRLRCTTDGTAWRISVSAEAVPAVELGWEVPPLPRPGRRLEPEATGPADVELATDIGRLTLAISGRGQLDGPHCQLAGPPEAEQRFRAAFTG